MATSKQTPLPAERTGEHGPTAAELRALAERAPLDDEPSSEAEMEGESAYQAWLRGETQAIPDEEVRRPLPGKDA